MSQMKCACGQSDKLADETTTECDLDTFSTATTRLGVLQRSQGGTRLALLV